MAKIVKAQALADSGSRGGYMLNSQVTVEVNPNHPAIKSLLNAVEEDRVTDEDITAAKLLVHVAKLQAGIDIEDPNDFAALVNTFVSKQLDVVGKEAEVIDEGELPDASEEDKEDEEDEEDEEEVEEDAAHDEL